MEDLNFNSEEDMIAEDVTNETASNITTQKTELKKGALTNSEKEILLRKFKQAGISASYIDESVGLNENLRNLKLFSETKEKTKSEKIKDVGSMLWGGYKTARKELGELERQDLDLQTKRALRTKAVIQAQQAGIGIQKRMLERNRVMPEGNKEVAKQFTFGSDQQKDMQLGSGFKNMFSMGGGLSQSGSLGSKFFNKTGEKGKKLGSKMWD